MLLTRKPGKRRGISSTMNLRFSLADSPLGRMLLAATDKGIRAVRFGEDDETLEATLRQ